jgi:uncharacterized membrane protein YkvA (DUF1232 family)
MKNVFYQRALNQASKVLGKKGRLLNLVGQLLNKSSHVNWSSINGETIKSKLSVFGRLGKAYALGHYREIPWSTMLIVVAAIIYFINPFDLLPDIIPVAGLTDDFGVLIWAYSSITSEIEKFLAWEQAQLTKL